jgi:hypothetical protein
MRKEGRRHRKPLDHSERCPDVGGHRRIDALLLPRNSVSSRDRVVGHLGILFAPLDGQIRRWTGYVNISAAATLAIVAFIVVVPGILVVGSLLNEAARSVAVISPMPEADRWTHLLDNHPRLAPALRWINERLDLSDLIKAAMSLMAGWSGSIVRASFSGGMNLLLTFYFHFFADGLGVGSVVLLPLDVGLHVGRWYQPHIMAERLELARPRCISRRDRAS